MSSAVPLPVQFFLATVAYPGFTLDFYKLPRDDLDYCRCCMNKDELNGLKKKPLLVPKSGNYNFLVHTHYCT